MDHLEVKLEKLKYVLLQKFDKELINKIANLPDVDFEMNASFLTDEITMRVAGFVWAEPLERVEHSYPADWWQAFKERWFPEWLLKRYPVRHRHIVLEAKALYPKVSFPDYEHEVYLRKNLSLHRDGEPWFLEDQIREE